MKKLFPGMLLLLSLQSSAQCFLREVSLRQRSVNSNLIIEGRVIGKHSFWNEDHTMIYTSNTIEVLKIFKGVLSSASIDILTLGGVVDDRMIKADPSLTLKEGETGIFLCERVKRFRALPVNRSANPRYEAYASVQGFLKYDLQSGTASDPFKIYRDIKTELYREFSPLMNYKIVKSFDLPAHPAIAQRIQAISGFSPAAVTAGTGTVLTINGSGFGATQGSGTVGFKNADDGGATYINPLPSQYLSWSNTQITVEVPSQAGTGTIQVTQGVTFTSGSSLTINYSHLNLDFDPGSGTISYQTDHVNDNGTGGYTWQMNTSFDANAAARASFMRAFDTWRCATKINWTIGATTAINDAVSDGTNVICFDNTSPLPAGVLGTCYSYWSGCASGPTIVWYVNELDIIFDEGGNISPLTWQFGPASPSGAQYDFESVAVHELGHGHQLGHVIDPGAIMHYALFNGATSRTLSANDLAGGNFVQSKNVVANVCGPGAMTNYAGCSTLPITVSGLNAYAKNNGIQVEWTNGAETEVDHYEVEKSTDGTLFTKAVSVLPKSNNNLSAAYDWLDAQPNTGRNFYRIKSESYHGDTRYSPIVLVDLTSRKDGFIVYPNPVNNNSLTVKLNNLNRGKYRLSLVNALGQEMFSKTILHNGGNLSESIDLPGIAAGIYSLRLLGKNASWREAIILNQKN